jgi:hypothetical protein
MANTDTELDEFMAHFKSTMPCMVVSVDFLWERYEEIKRKHGTFAEALIGSVKPRPVSDTGAKGERK